MEKRRKSIETKWDNIEKNGDAYQQQFGEPQGEGFTGVVMTSFKITTGRMSDNFKAALFDFVQVLLGALGDVAYIILYLISTIYRIILTIIAPLAIAISMFEGTSNNATEWFGKYVNYSLLPTVAGIYQTIASQINLAFFQSYDATADMVMPDQDPFSFGIAYTAVLIMLLIGYMQIPSITNMIMVVGGTSGIVQGLTRNSQKGVRAGVAQSVMGGSLIKTGARNVSRTFQAMSSNPNPVQQTIKNAPRYPYIPKK